MKYYADLNGKFDRVLYDWSQCQKYMKEIGGLNFKSYPTFDEALAAIKSLAHEDKKTNGALNTAGSKKDNQTETQGEIPKIGVIGCDEVGKVEPFKQLMSVSVYYDTSFAGDIKAGDSKGNSKEKNAQIGKMITGIESFDEIDDRAHFMEKYGIIYCAKIITNEEYNAYKDAGKNINCVLSYAHNETLLKVYDEAKTREFEVKRFVIDDFLSNANDHSMQFGVNVDIIKKGVRKINEIKDMEVFLTKKAENKFKNTVGLASNIGDYFDQLWQSKVRDVFKEAGIDFCPRWFSNFGADAQSEINEVFSLISSVYGSLDLSPITVKHTKYYETYVRDKCIR